MLRSVISLVFLAALACSQAAVVVSENFESSTLGDALPDPAGWTLFDNNAPSIGPDFDIVDEGGNQILSIVSTFNLGLGTTPGGFALAPTSQGDFTARFDLRLDHNGSFDDALIAFGYQNPTNYYFFTFHERANASAWYKVEDGARTTLGTSSWTGSENDWHRASVSYEDDTGTLNVSVDGSLVFIGTDNTFTSGGIGFGSFNDRASFDNVSISNLATITLPEPSTVALWGLGVGLLHYTRRRKQIKEGFGD